MSRLRVTRRSSRPSPCPAAWASAPRSARESPSCRLPVNALTRPDRVGSPSSYAPATARVTTRRKNENRPEGRFRAWNVEATTGFEPVSRGFADPRVEPLHHVAPGAAGRRPMGLIELAAPRGFEPRFTDSKSAVLPLDEGAAAETLERRPAPGQENGAEDGTRTRDPHLGKVMLYQLSHFRSITRPPPKRWCREPESNWRHRDFQSRALPTELSRPDGQPGSVTRRRARG
jgi:hypothetical protein